MDVNLRHWHSHSGAADVPSVLGCEMVFLHKQFLMFRRNMVTLFFGLE